MGGALWSMLAAMVVSAVVQTPAHAACNSIPYSRRFYPSDRGSVDRRLLVPDQPVTVTLPKNCVSSPLFDQTLTANAVKLVFTHEPKPTSPVPDLEVPVPPDRVTDCAAGECRTLVFTPSSSLLDPKLPPTTSDGRGPAGSVRIVVTRATS